jgi:hypothetical protein
MFLDVHVQIWEHRRASQQQLLGPLPRWTLRIDHWLAVGFLHWPVQGWVRVHRRVDQRHSVSVSGRPVQCSGVRPVQRLCCGLVQQRVGDANAWLLGQLQRGLCMSASIHRPHSRGVSCRDVQSSRSWSLHQLQCRAVRCHNSHVHRRLHWSV